MMFGILSAVFFLAGLMVVVFPGGASRREAAFYGFLSGILGMASLYREVEL